MNCPLCKTTTLAASDLPTGETVALTARTCSGCGGAWVAGDVYLLWVARHGGGPPPIHEWGDDDRTAAALVPASPAGEPTKAKLCPPCGRLLSRAKVGHGLAFQLDRCVTCGGFWFDAGEWDALLARGLHDDAHHVFSPAWQADVLKHDRRLQHDRLMIAKLGEADWREIRRIKTWIDGHEHRAELHAVLRED
jgi:Zn-finger nucleic acid-binding protein